MSVIQYKCEGLLCKSWIKKWVF